MNFKKSVLPNGIRVITTPMPALESATVTLWVKTGSRNESDKIAGLSHFIEHMAFKGTKKWPSAKAIAQEVDAIGGEVNAGTFKDWTNFYIKSGVGKIDKAFDIVSDIVHNPLLKPDEIKRESGVIVEELAMYEDTPMIKIADVFEEVIFEGSSLARDIGGTPETVRSLVRDDFIRYRGIHYYPENMVLTVAGGVDEARVLALAEKYFTSLKFKIQNSKLEKFKPKQREPQIKLHPKKKEQAHLILGYLGDGRGYKNRFAQAVLAVILGGSMSSRLFIEVRERRGLAYAVRTSTDRYEDVGYIGTYAGVTVGKAGEAIKVILDEHESLKTGQKKIDKDEIVRAKEILKGHLALSLEDTRQVNTLFGEQALFLDRIMTPEEITAEIDKVTVDDILFEAKRLFKPERLNLAIIGPYTSDAPFAKLLK